MEDAPKPENGQPVSVRIHSGSAHGEIEYRINFEKNNVEWRKVVGSSANGQWKGVKFKPNSNDYWGEQFFELLTRKYFYATGGKEITFKQSGQGYKPVLSPTQSQASSSANRPPAQQLTPAEIQAFRARYIFEYNKIKSNHRGFNLNYGSNSILGVINDPRSPYHGLIAAPIPGNENYFKVIHPSLIPHSAIHYLSDKFPDIIRICDSIETFLQHQGIAYADRKRAEAPRQSTAGPSNAARRNARGRSNR